MLGPIEDVIVTSPINSISDRMASHRSAQGVIYADMLANSKAKVKVTIDYGNKEELYNQYDTMAVYHGNDFSGALNIFGGLENTEVATNLLKFSKFRGTVISLGIPFPDYVSMIKSRVSKSKKTYPKVWDEIDFENLEKMRANSFTLKHLVSNKIAIGDSHAIALYRADWRVNSVPFKTLNGALNEGLQTYIPEEITEAEFLFGAIDIRHHLCRVSPDHKKNAEELAIRYLKAVEELDIEKKTIYVPLPLENESRKIPTTGCYKGKPFWGTWAERNQARKVFIETLISSNTVNIDIKDPWDYLLNDKGELDMAKMEKPRSVHLSREFYPFWQGKKWQPKSNKKSLV